MHLMTEDTNLAQELAQELLDIQGKIRPCEYCRSLAEIDEHGHAVCPICRDPQRDLTLLCVVSKVQDVIALEKSHVLKCRYFVLGHLLSPLDGVHAHDIPTDELAQRIRQDHVKELIIATPPTVDGEATALHLVHELSPLGITFSRIASGIPHGGDLEYSDQVTLGRALLGRRPLSPAS